jgi:hypothetical protein
VSHAANDKPVVDLIVDLLKHGIGVPADRIYCTTLEQSGSKAGEQFIKSVFKRLNAPKVVFLALISGNFNDSPFCGNEVGAAWIKQREPLLCVIPPSSYKALTGVLVDRQAPTLAKRATLEELRTRVTRLLSLRPSRSDEWNAGVRRFLDRLGPATLDVERKRAGIEHDVFLSTPMSTVSDKDYVRIRGMGLKLLEALRKGSDASFSDHYAAKTYASKRQFDQKAKAVERDLAALRASQHYILILDKQVITSAYFEAGMALAYAEASDSHIKRRSTYFVRSGVTLPFMMQELRSKYSSVEIFEYEDEKDLLSTVARYPSSFGTTRWESWGIEEQS